MKRTKNKSLLEYEKKSKEETQKKIIKAIETLKNQFKRISIASISKEAGVSRATLYSYKELIDEKSKSAKQISNLTIKEIENIINENISLKKRLKELGHDETCKCEICSKF